MIFNSIDFAIFLPIVFVVYWWIKNLKRQNLLVLFASYLFYGWWDWRFLFLIIFSTIVDYYVGVGLSNTENKNRRKILLWISITVNLGFLVFFKYFNFFAESFTDAFTFLGYHIESSRLNIILPVGISFYTFQTMSYSIDVYKKKLEPTKNFVAFAAFVSFFPQLVAGPIERATRLLPQFYKKRIFDYSKAIDGLRQVLWGIFKKVVIADNCAEFANQIFNNSANMDGSTLVLGALFFTFQIYGDFSGYSDIAIGTSRLFGFDLKKNFAFPYFSRDIAEFWRRWHISLSSWFKDYLYIPLGGSRGGLYRTIRNTFIIFLVSGFWHGANWTFIVWGGLNAIYCLPLLLRNKNRANIEIVAYGKRLPSLKESYQILRTFAMTTVAWIFFRANSIEHALNYILGIFSVSLFSVPVFSGRGKALTVLVIIIVFLLVEWRGRANNHALEAIGVQWKSAYRIAFYYLVILAVFYYGGSQQDFIYFQF